MRANFEKFEIFAKNLGQRPKRTKFQTLSDFDEIWHTSAILDVELRNEDPF